MIVAQVYRLNQKMTYHHVLRRMISNGRIERSRKIETACNCRSSFNKIQIMIRILPAWDNMRQFSFEDVMLVPSELLDGVSCCISTLFLLHFYALLYYTPCIL